jgi:hypothetical protein
LAFTSLSGLSNEGPIDESAVLKTGNLTLLQKKEIFLEKEMLHISLEGDFAHVYGYYELINPGPEDEVTIGFPVDFLKDSEIYGIAWQQESLPYYQLSDENGKLEIKEYIDEKPQVVIYDGRKRDVLRRWYVTEVKFPANSCKKLVVKYTVRNSLLDMDSVATFFPLYSDRLFTYFFVPNEGWGNDIINWFQVIIDVRDNIETGTVIKSLNLPGVSSYGGLFIYETENFSLQDAPELKILYDNSASLLTEFVNAYQIKEDNILSLRASSKFTDHTVDKLMDLDFSTAWVTGKEGNGVGEWVEIKLKDFCLQSVGIINGVTSNEKTYNSFNRIKKLKIEIEQDEYDFFADRAKKRKIEQIVDLEEKELSTFNQKAFAPFISVLADLGQTFNKTYRVRLTILEVYPGTINRTGISEVFLMGYKNDQEFIYD